MRLEQYADQCTAGRQPGRPFRGTGAAPNGAELDRTGRGKGRLNRAQCMPPGIAGRPDLGRHCNRQQLAELIEGHPNVVWQRLKMQCSSDVRIIAQTHGKSRHGYKVVPNTNLGNKEEMP